MVFGWGFHIGCSFFDFRNRIPITRYSAWSIYCVVDMNLFGTSPIPIEPNMNENLFVYQNFILN